MAQAQWVCRLAAGAVMLGAFSGAAQAQKAGDWVLSTGPMYLAPQDSSKPLRLISPRQQEIPGTGSTVSNATTLGLSAIYFVTDNWGLEGVLGVPPKFKLHGEDALAPVGKLGEARQWSPAFLAKYFFGEPTSTWRFSVGLGLSYVWYSDVKLTPGMQAAVGARMGLPAGASTTSGKLSSSWAPVFNVGLDYAIDDHWGIGASLSYLPLKTTATLSTKVGGRTVATSQTRMTLNPVVGYLKLNYRF